MPTVGEPLRLSPETLTTIGGALCEVTSDLETDHRTKFEDFDVHRDWYDAKPRTRIRNTPWPNASNVVVPLIQISTDNVATRIFQRLHTPRKTWVATTENEAWRDSVGPFVNHINWASRNLFDIVAPSYDWVHEGCLLGESILGPLRWEERIQYRMVPGRRKPIPVTVSRGPCISFTPREMVLWRRDRPLQESDTVLYQTPMSWNDLVFQAQVNGWDMDAVRESEGYPGIEGATGVLLRGQRQREGVSTRTSPGDLHDVRQAFVMWSSLQLLGRRTGRMNGELDLDADDFPVPALITYHRRSRQILDARAYPYFFSHWPFYEFYYRKRAGRGSALGIAKRGEHMQRAASTSVNQAFDSNTLANSIKVVTTDPKVAGRRFRPEEVILVGNIVNDIEFPSIPKNPVPDITLANYVTGIHERQTGSNDPMLGKETRLGGHPAPATSTLALMDQSSTQMVIPLMWARRSISQLGEDIATLYQQFEGNEDGTIDRIHGAGDAEQIMRIVTPLDPEGYPHPVAGNLAFDVYAMNETLNPEAERQKNLIVSQVTQNYYANMMRAVQIMESQDPSVTPGVKQVAAKSLEALTEAQKRFLESSDIDDLERFVMESRNGQRTNVEALERLRSFITDQLGGAGGAPTPEGAGSLAQQPGVLRVPGTVPAATAGVARPAGDQFVA